MKPGPILIVTACWLLPPLVSGQETGRESPSAATADHALQQTVRQFMDTTGATAANVAVCRHGELVYSRSLGFADRRQTIPVRSTTTMRLASCTKPVTRAAVEQLIAAGRLERQTPVYEYLGIRPGPDGLADPRIEQITIDHLLQHEGGWDRDATFDPLYRTGEIQRELGLGRLQKHHVVRYMWSRPLQFDPGERECYSNFGYLLLGLVIEKTTGKSYIQSVRELVAAPLGIEDFAISSAVRSARSPHEVYYPDENGLNLKLRDSSSGLAASAESMVRFMGGWWIDGQPRHDDRNVYLYQIGTHPLTTTTLMEQRLDGLDYVIMLNRRREDSYPEDNAEIRQQFNELLDEVGHLLGD